MEILPATRFGVHQAQNELMNLLLVMVEKEQ